QEMEGLSKGGSVLLDLGQGVVDLALDVGGEGAAGHLHHIGQAHGAHDAALAVLLAGVHHAHHAAVGKGVQHVFDDGGRLAVGQQVGDLVLDGVEAFGVVEGLAGLAGLGIVEPVGGVVALGQVVGIVVLSHAVEGGGVGHLAAAGGDGVGAGLQVNVLEHGAVVDCLEGARLNAVDRQGDGGAVVVDGDVPLAGGAVHKAAAADVDHGLGGPVGLVDVEGVLLGLAVVGDKALVVAALDAALVAAVGGKVEHIPHMGGPQVGPGGEGLEHIVVVLGGVLLGVVVVFRVGGVPLEDALGAVLRDAQAAVGVHGVELVQPGAVVGGLAEIPAEVVVVALHVGDGVVLAFHGGHGDLGHGGHAAGVQALGQGVDLTQVLAQVLAVFADEDLVGDAPEEDGGVVVVLGHQLGHLAEGVVVGLLAGDEAADEGDLGPEDEAGVVAQVVEILVVLVVGQADGVGAHLFDEGEVLLVVGAADGPALVQPVLMAGDAVQGDVFAVEPEAGVGVHVE